VLCWGLGENDPTLTKYCACAQERNVKNLTGTDLLRLRTNMKRQKLAVGSLAKKYNETYVFYHRKWTVPRWGLGENDPTITKSCACAQE